MPNNIKKYLITSLTLCAIGAVAAVAIAGTNLLTEKRIAQNELKAQTAALEAVFEGAKFSDPHEDFALQSNSYLVKYYVASSTLGDEIGYVYYTSGRNAYGEISMMIGVTPTDVNNFSIVSNTQSFASTLEDNYIVPIQNGGKSFNDVSCGATYGAKLIKAMADEAQADYQLKKGGN